MTQPPATVVVVDDDPAVREALESLLRSVGLRVQLFGSVAEFLGSARPEGPSCLVLDVRLPGRSGLDLQDELIRTETRLPVIFITGHGGIQMSVRAMKAGAVEFLTKPFRDQELLDAVQVALERDRARREAAKALACVQSRYQSLTAREREVMALVVTGRPNKTIAAAIGLSEITVKAHRGRVMRKMGARSLANVVRIADSLNKAHKVDAWHYTPNTKVYIGRYAGIYPVHDGAIDASHNREQVSVQRWRGRCTMPRATDPRRTIFIFDGDAEVRESLAAALRRSGFDVTTFEDSDAFVAAAKASAPACIVVDAQSAGRPATDILRELGGRAYTAPIVMISGQIDVPSVVEIFKHGALDVIEKPFYPPGIVGRLREVIDTWTRRRR